MNLTAATAKIRRRLGEDAADFWTDADITAALNESIRNFAHEADWSWLSSFVSIAVAAAAVSFPIPVDVDAARIIASRIVITGIPSYKLKRVTPGDGFRLMSVYATASNPRWYFVYSTVTATGTSVTTARLVPVVQTAGAVEMLYYRRPADLTTGADEIDLPEDTQDGVVAYATATLWLHELDASGVKAGEQMAMYQDMVDKALMQESKLGDDEQLAIGKMDDEAERVGMVGMPAMPEGYGYPVDGWGE